MRGSPACHLRIGYISQLCMMQNKHAQGLPGKHKPSVARQPLGCSTVCGTLLRSVKMHVSVCLWLMLAYVGASPLQDPEQWLEAVLPGTSIPSSLADVSAGTEAIATTKGTNPSQCDSALQPVDTRCTGCPPRYNGKLCASTTMYNDPTKGACGVSPDPNAKTVPKTYPSKSQYTAAINAMTLDPNHPSLSWCPSGCGICYKLCTTGGATNGESLPGQNIPGKCLVVKAENRCGDGLKFNAAGGAEVAYPEWCSQLLSFGECAAYPQRCKTLGNTNKYGYPAHFDLQNIDMQIIPTGGATGPPDTLNINNGEVTFEVVSCSEWNGPQWGGANWHSQCPSADPAYAPTWKKLGGGGTSPALGGGGTRKPNPPPAPPGQGGDCSKQYEQCGGEGWSGPKCCQTGLTCTPTNKWYSGCVL